MLDSYYLLTSKNIRYMRSTQLIITILSISLLFSSAFASEQQSELETLTIVTPSWKNFTEETGEGFYFDLARLIFEPIGVSVSYIFAPWARAVKIVLSGHADALVGSYKEKPQQFHYPQRPIWLDISAAAFKKNRVSWIGTSSLNERKVAWIRGYGYDAYLKANMDIVKVNNNEQGWAMLSLERVDAYIDSLTDLQLYIKEHGINPEEFRTEEVLAKEMYMRFSNSEKGKKLAEIYDQRILELIQNGQLKTLYQKWGYEGHYLKFVNLFESNIHALASENYKDTNSDISPPLISSQ